MTITPDKLRACAASGNQWAPIEAADCSVLADALEIADDSSIALLESEVKKVEDGWLDTASADDFAVDAIEQAVGYLAARGLIERHPEREKWVKVREEA